MPNEVADGSQVPFSSQHANQDEPQARLLLALLQTAFPLLAKACEIKREKMVAAGASEQEVLEELLKLARPFMDTAPDTDGGPMSPDDAMAMLARF